MSKNIISISIILKRKFLNEDDNINLTNATTYNICNIKYKSAILS